MPGEEGRHGRKKKKHQHMRWVENYHVRGKHNMFCLGGGDRGRGGSEGRTHVLLAIISRLVSWGKNFTGEKIALS